MTRVQDVLDRLATRLGSRPVAVPVRAEADLSGSAGIGPLVPTDGALVQALDAITAPVPHDRTARAILAACEWPAGTSITLTDGLDTARTAAIAQAERATGRNGFVDAEDPTDEQLRGHAAWIVEPLDAERLRTARRRSNDLGCHLIVDESRTFGRTAERLAQSDADVTADACLLGESLALGLPFAAALGVDVRDLPAPTELAASVAAIVVDLVGATPTATRLADFGRRLRERFDASCAREDIHARLVGPDACLCVEFQGQEMAEAPLMALHFGLELERIGFSLHEGWFVPHADLDEASIGRWCDAIDRAVARMRCLLIEHNSYLCGEVRYPFPAGDPTVVDRGLALYRYPKLGPVELTSEADAFRIHFLGGELGEVTSSGFYLPTLFTGDFDVRCEYRVHHWEPGPDSACLALFAQNLASSKRYYAQRMSSGHRPNDHAVLGSLATVLSEAQPIATPSGEFRITREGHVLTAFHRAPGTDDWVQLARDEDATTDDVVFGVKIWSKVESGRIEATIHDLTIEAQLADEQIPRLEHRPDPRSA